MSPCIHQPLVSVEVWIPHPVGRISPRDVDKAGGHGPKAMLDMENPFGAKLVLEELPGPSDSTGLEGGKSLGRRRCG